MFILFFCQANSEFALSLFFKMVSFSAFELITAPHGGLPMTWSAGLVEDPESLSNL